MSVIYNMAMDVLFILPTGCL